MGTKLTEVLLKSFLAVVCLASVVISSRSALKDTGEFQYNASVQGSVNFWENWENAKCLAAGNNIYDPAVIQKFNLQPNYLPNSFVFLFPFTALSWPMARGLWLALNLFFTAWLAWQMSVLFWEKKHALLLFALISSSACWSTLIHAGQFTLWSFCFFLLALRWDRENRPFLSGLAITLCLLKYALTVPLLLYFIVYRRSWKNVAVAAGIHAVIFGWVAFFLKISPWDLFLGPVRSANHMNVAGRGYLDLLAFWYRATGHAAGSPYLLSALLILGALVWILQRLKGKDDLGALSLVVMAALTVMFHNNYDYVGAIFPLIWCVKQYSPRDGVVLTIGSIAAAVLYLSSHYFEFFPHMDWVMDFMKSDGYLLSLSLLWYLSLGLLWAKLKSEALSPTL